MTHPWMAYTPTQWSKDGRTSQHGVVYVGLEGKDEGRTFNCSLHDFAKKFRLVPLTEAENGAEGTSPPMPERIADNSILGSGV
mgnify:CR=1 FL=1